MGTIIIIRVPIEKDNQLSIADKLCECDKYHRDNKLRLALGDEREREPLCHGYRAIRKVSV